MNHHHERELTHLVAEHDRAEIAGEVGAQKEIAKRILLHYGYRVVPRACHRNGAPKLIK